MVQLRCLLSRGLHQSERSLSRLSPCSRRVRQGRGSGVSAALCRPHNKASTGSSQCSEQALLENKLWTNTWRRVSSDGCCWPASRTARGAEWPQHPTKPQQQLRMRIHLHPCNWVLQQLLGPTKEPSQAVQLRQAGTPKTNKPPILVLWSSFRQIIASAIHTACRHGFLEKRI